MSLMASGDKAKYQDVANHLQKFVDAAAKTRADTTDAKEILDFLEKSKNIVPRKAPATKPGG
jgi:hypothetical protein